MCGILLAFGLPAQAQQAAEEILKAIVKVRAVIPEDARTARSLGTEREGSGVLIDAISSWKPRLSKSSDRGTNQSARRLLDMTIILALGSCGQTNLSMWRP
jgi:hypothetical protein